MADDYPCQNFLKAATEFKESFNEVMQCDVSPPSAEVKAQLGLECTHIFAYMERARVVLCKDCTHEPTCTW